MTTTIETIEPLVCNKLGVEPEQLTTKARPATVALARNIICYIAREHLKLGVCLIAQRYGLQSPSSVSAAWRRIDSYHKAANVSKTIIGIGLTGSDVVKIVDDVVAIINIQDRQP